MLPWSVQVHSETPRRLCVSDLLPGCHPQVPDSNWQIMMKWWLFTRCQLHIKTDWILWWCAISCRVIFGFFSAVYIGQFWPWFVQALLQQIYYPGVLPRFWDSDVKKRKKKRKNDSWKLFPHSLDPSTWFEHDIWICKGTTDAEIEIPSAETLELSKVLTFRPEVGQNRALHTLPVARNSPLFNFFGSQFFCVLTDMWLTGSSISIN